MKIVTFICHIGILWTFNDEIGVRRLLLQTLLMQLDPLPVRRLMRRCVLLWPIGVSSRVSVYNTVITNYHLQVQGLFPGEPELAASSSVFFIHLFWKCTLPAGCPSYVTQTSVLRHGIQLIHWLFLREIRRTSTTICTSKINYSSVTGEIITALCVPTERDTALKNKNSSGDEIANVNFYAVRPEATRIRWNNPK